jgi:hypothetical protein
MLLSETYTCPSYWECPKSFPFLLLSAGVRVSYPHGIKSPYYSSLIEALPTSPSRYFFNLPSPFNGGHGVLPRTFLKFQMHPGKFLRILETKSSRQLNRFLAQQSLSNHFLRTTAYTSNAESVLIGLMCDSLTSFNLLNARSAETLETDNQAHFALIHAMLLGGRRVTLTV